MPRVLAFDTSLGVIAPRGMYVDTERYPVVELSSR